MKNLNSFDTLYYEIMEEGERLDKLKQMAGQKAKDMAIRGGLGAAAAAATLINPLAGAALTKGAEGAYKIYNATDPEPAKLDDLAMKIKQYEGDKDYQTRVGSFKDGRFYPYKDAHGQSIGYGHFIKPTENFDRGITEKQAEELLMSDVQQAAKDAQELIQSNGVDTPNPDLVNIITQMVFQLGKDGTRKFKNMWAALKQGDYVKASEEMLNSRWATQTSTRAEAVAAEMRLLSAKDKDKSSKR